MGARAQMWCVCVCLCVLTTILLVAFVVRAVSFVVAPQIDVDARAIGARKLVGRVALCNNSQNPEIGITNTC